MFLFDNIPHNTVNSCFTIAEQGRRIRLNGSEAAVRLQRIDAFPISPLRQL